MNYDEYMRYLRKKLLMMQRVMANTRIFKENCSIEQVVVKEESERKEKK